MDIWRCFYLQGQNSKQDIFEIHRNQEEIQNIFECVRWHYMEVGGVLRSGRGMRREDRRLKDYFRVFG